MKDFRHKIFFLSKNVLLFLGIVFLLFIFLGFTDLPFWAYYRLSCAREYHAIHPAKIVFMGAEGMPSEKNLIRCYYTAEFARKFPKAKVIIALPVLPGKNSGRYLSKIKKELMTKGVDPTRLEFETAGTNTFTQVRNICKNITPSDSILVITSPENMKRTLMCFYKKNITHIEGFATFGADLNPKALLKTDGSVDMVQSLKLRYNIWTQFQYEIIVAREYLALLYYQWKGWI